MSDYVIGDVQGCYDPLLRLLDKFHYNDRVDRLWFVGDLVNRGPESLAVLRFIKNLPLAPRITLGNHDLHLLNRLFGENALKNKDDTLHEILEAKDAESLGHWLRSQFILYHDPDLNVVMCHAGIAPIWDLEEAKRYARELEEVIQGPNYRDFFSNMYGNKPNAWSPDLTGMDRFRVITNYFTRMRFCDTEGRLDFSYKGVLNQAPSHLYPWFALPNRLPIKADIVFGHWAALQGYCPYPGLYALDTGCLWGGPLTALRLQDKQYFSVPGFI